MTVYLDLTILINFIFDFILLTSVSIILNRRTTIKKLLLSSILGSLMIIVSMLDNGYLLYIFKFINTILMLVVCFGYKDIRYTIANLIYLYITSITLGGFLYLITIKLNYHRDNLIIYRNNYQVSIISLLIISPIILYLYTKTVKKLKNNYSNYYNIIITLNNNTTIKTTAFLDTGNGLYDPYHHRPIILINKNLVDITNEKVILVPYSTASGHELLECITINNLYIEGIGYKKKLLLGLTSHKINIDGIEVILHSKLLE